MQSPDEVVGIHFRKQLAACVRSIQWSYAIFWSLSASQEGLLVWNDGFYNGDIKTRKTTQATECKADQMGLQRSEQLRELYESLSTVECNEQSTRPSASLSPEDLTEAEWYYLICMSFTFNLGQDLPGKVYEHNEPVWLSNVQVAENRCFSRCLLAKSASIQTVVGLPFMDGVLELGTSELVLEDPGFVQRIVNSFWEFQDPVSSEQSTSSPPFVRKEDTVCTNLDHGVDNSMLLENHPLITENDSHVFPVDVDSFAPNKQSRLMHNIVYELHSSICEKIACSSEGRSNTCADHSSIKRQNEPWNVHIRNLMDDEVKNDPHCSLNSGECLSWSFAQNILSSPRGERIKGNIFDNLQEDNHAKVGSFSAEGDGFHYARTLSTILGNLKQQVSLPGIPYENRFNKSSFKIWKRGSRVSKIFADIPQRMLKSILIDSKRMNGDHLVKLQDENVAKNKTWKAEADDANSNHVLSERRRREKLNEKFLVLRSLVPSISKVDKTSILADTIEYLKELERRVEELESCREEADPDMKARRKYPDIAERTSDNYGNNDLVNPKKPSSNKRKASELDEAKDENLGLLPKNGLVDINITMVEKVVLIEMQCPWRDLLLLDIIEAMNNLHLDAQSVQSSIDDGNLSITLRSKFGCSL
ncbi:transcription factor EGL1-like isoform X2 [Phalaenopsis equestris]|uniref:transcription factor EGL1-like isoform X2 n=1 Tax=Phalaenopsis equestris TaxID=78828 RepID=UPI0009E1D8E3|nr:transcription factor EGL1-like isoform X2 [Phalaenopsis equestris]